jgi:hypothetical protein
MRRGGYVARMEWEKAHKVFWLENVKGDRLEDLGRKHEYTAEVDIKEIEWQSVGGIYMAQDRGQWRARLTQ